MHRLEQFLRSGNIWFSRADKFGDKLECVKIDDFSNQKLNYEAIRLRKKKTLISCWHLANIESVAMWDTYVSKNEDRRTTAIKFNRKNLVELLSTSEFQTKESSDIKYVHGKVQYKNLVNVNENRLSRAKVKYAAFRKENAFKYESEYRFTVKNDSIFKNEGINFKIGNPNNIDFNILINPLLDKEEIDERTDKINNLGFLDKVQKSNLYNWFHANE
ncbi:hypothetical protein AAY42_00985 [Flagellimonas eckloniae]|uniref:DUF2971 domain-containing protein n=2 Tax=Flagellimonas eckloniae TaxID=346185 RepID=A0A0N8WFG5_9FLAO|nr:hypothetical protein AAY42_00985 [Allomuricauda eckloniae]